MVCSELEYTLAERTCIWVREGQVGGHHTHHILFLTLVVVNKNSKVRE